MQVPSWTEFWTVDEACECLNITAATRTALLTAMPNAYGEILPGHEPGEGGHEYPPEPDCRCRKVRAVARVWAKLPAQAQEDLWTAMAAVWPEGARR